MFLPKVAVVALLFILQIAAEFTLKLPELEPFIEEFCDTHSETLCETCVLYNNSIYKIYYKALRNLGILEKDETTIKDNLEYIGKHVGPLKSLVSKMIKKCDVEGAKAVLNAFVMAPLVALENVAGQQPYLH